MFCNFRSKLVLLGVILGASLSHSAYTGPTTSAGINLIKRFEGFRANFYRDSVGISTIGYGHACHVNDCNNIQAPISKSEAHSLLIQDLRSYENCVRSKVRYSRLTSTQFSALVSFTFNLGCGTLQKSKLLKYLNNSQVANAAHEFRKYVYAGKRKLPGLVRRREAERALFLTRS